MASSSMKYVSLGVLIVQTTSLVLVLRYSRIVGLGKGGSDVVTQYLSSTAVVMVEFCKVLACCLVVFYVKGFRTVDFVATLCSEIVDRPWDTMKMLVPSGLYVVQNNLLYVALTNLDAATYQVTYQLKILTTAMFSVVMLNKRLGSLQWVSLLFLVLGVSLVQIPGESSRANGFWQFPSGPQSVGLVAIAAACFSSGFAGVYFEKILKGTLQSLWIRNIQLGIFGMGFGLVGVLLNDMPAVRKNGFFQGYTQVTWIVITLQAFGGILVAVVIKYADNILKGFAASLSIILSVVFSYLVLGDLTTSRYFLLGTAIVLGSTVLYTCQPQSSPTPKHDSVISKV